MTESLAFAGIGELSGQLQSGEISTLELTELFAERINQLNDKSKAFISLDLENAKVRAAFIDQQAEKKLLSGIPYSCKDLFDVKGIVTTGGSKVLADNIANHDADSITRMNAGGAIFLGKNNLHEFAYGATGENSTYGTPPNPYDHSRLAGGSSSGSVAAVGFGLCAAALGTDTGGSVRAPAALCGLVGFKPTYGRVSTEGVLPYSWTLDHVGTITRNCRDTAALFNVLRQTDETRRNTFSGIGRLRIGIPDSFFYDRVDSEIKASCEQLIANLKNSGAEIKAVKMPSMEYTRTVSLTIQMPEALSYHNRYLETRGEMYSQDFRAGLALGQCLLAEQYIRAKRFVETYRRDTESVFTDVDLLLTPATPAIAPEIGAVNIDIDGYSEPAGNAITRFTSFFNMTGHPAITFPCGMHSKGLPIAAQLIGRHYEDEFLLSAAAMIEQEFALGVPLPKVD
jgi:aspartyl-tRNA(Asn)/glutamyl-tRNA(Gln) amidotransferase subunit A